MASQAVLELLVELKDQASSGLASLGGALTSLGTIGLGVAAGGVAAVGAALVAGVGDAREAAQIMGQTEAVIKSTGSAAGVSAQQVADYAASLSAASGKSLFGDDDIQRGENMLLTFTNIKETLPDATKTMLDLSQAMGQDTKSSAIQLGKALNDPIKGVTALTRVGVTFDEQQKRQIETMQKAGNIAGAQGIILAELNKEFGGSAEAAAKADGGWAQFKDRMGEAAETAGAALLPLLLTLAGFLNDTVAPAIETVAGGFADLIAAFQTGAEGGDFLGGLINALYSLEGVSPVFTTIGDGLVILGGLIDDTFGEGGGLGVLADDLREMTGIDLSPLIATFTDAATPIEGLVAVLSEVSPAFALIAGVVQETLPNVLTIVQTVFGDIAAYVQANGAEMLTQVQATWVSIHDTVLSLVQPIADVVNAILAQILAFWQANGQDILAFVGSTWAQINSIIQVAMQLIQATIVPILQAIAAFINSHGAEIQNILKNAWDTISGIISTALNIIQGLLRTVLQAIQGDWSGAWQTLQQTSASFVQGIIGVVTSFLNTIAGFFGTSLGEIARVWESNWNNFISTVETVADRIISTLEALPGQMIGIGADIVDGIISGVENAAGQLYSTLENMASNALQSAKDALGISSPSQVMADEVGIPLVLGILEGMQDALPDLIDGLDGLGDDLLDKARGLAAKVGDALGDAFDASAGIDRQKAKNLDAIADLSQGMQTLVNQQLAAAEQVAATITDPAAARQYFKEQSQQIFELAKLREKLSNETDATARGRLYDQIALIESAQAKEDQAFQERQQGNRGPLAALGDQVQRILDSIKEVPDTASNEARVALQSLYDMMLQLFGAGAPGAPGALPLPGGGGGALPGGTVVLPAPPPLNLQAGAIVINAAPGQNEQRIAELVIAEIDRRRRGRGS